MKEKSIACFCNVLLFWELTRSDDTREMTSSGIAVLGKICKIRKNPEIGMGIAFRFQDIDSGAYIQNKGK
jgi:hypothetical protein